MLSGDETAVTYFGFPNSQGNSIKIEFRMLGKSSAISRNFQNRDAVALILNIGSTCADN
jgi:hypothetical protein